MSTVVEVRKQVREQIRLRGLRRFDVWTGFASKGPGLFVMDGTPSADHLVWMEGDPNVLKYTIPTEPAFEMDSGNVKASTLSAICEMRTGTVEWREVKSDEEAKSIIQHDKERFDEKKRQADAYGVQWRIITTSEIQKNGLLIRNWRRGLAYMWAAVNHDLKHFEAVIETILRPRHSLSLEQILQSFDAQDEPLVMAALFRMAQTGQVSTDLDTRKLDRKSCFKWGYV